MKLKSLLIIDDNDDYNTLVKIVLELNTGWKIITASKGKEGITKAKLQQPDVILLDMVMPELNGLDVYKLLKSNWSTCSIPIIFLTAMVMTKEIINSQITEDVQIIIKPFDIMELENEVIQVYNRYLALSN